MGSLLSCIRKPQQNQQDSDNQKASLMPTLANYQIRNNRDNKNKTSYYGGIEDSQQSKQIQENSYKEKQNNKYRDNKNKTQYYGGIEDSQQSKQIQENSFKETQKQQIQVSNRSFQRQNKIPQRQKNLYQQTHIETQKQSEQYSRFYKQRQQQLRIKQWIGEQQESKLYKQKKVKSINAEKVQKQVQQKQVQQKVQKQKYRQYQLQQRQKLLQQQQEQEQHRLRITLQQQRQARQRQQLRQQQQVQNQRIAREQRMQRQAQQQQFDNEIYSEARQIIADLITNQNCLEVDYQIPGKQYNIKNIFQSQQQYTNILVQLVKYQIIQNINQSLQKKLSSENIRPIPGKFIKQNKIIQFLPANQQFATKLARYLSKGEKACLVSTDKNVNMKNIEQALLKQICIVSYKPRDKKFTVKLKEDTKIVLHSQMYLYEIEQIITSVRQLAAVLNIKECKHLKYILNPTLSNNTDCSQARNLLAKNSQIMSMIKQKRNPSQINSIESIISAQSGIFLVQGPPGTGKTATILSIISMQYSMLRKISPNNPKAIVVCSESNAAIDDIANKIKKQGLVGLQIHSNSVLRLGQVSLNSKHLINFNLRHRIEVKLFGQKTTVEYQIQLEEKQIKLKGIDRDNTAQRNKIYKQIRILEAEIVRINESIEQHKEKYNQIQDKILNKTQIVLSTLSSSGRVRIIQQFIDKVGCLIIDEACQTTEPSTLLPFFMQPDKVLLVGDPKQLQPTVIAKNSKSRYERSLFQRFTHCKIKPFFLDTQYRMVPEISQFPNNKFYAGRLKNGRTHPKPDSFQYLQASFRSSSIMFMDIHYGKETKNKKSYMNMEQARIISYLARKFAKMDPNLTIGVITPYSEQTLVAEGQLITQLPIPEMRKNIKVSTVDAFQGQQRDIIIITCVRAGKQIGFLNNERRLNVALTRAQNAIIIVGREATLSQDSMWRQLIQYYKDKNAFFKFGNQDESIKHIDKQFIRKV